LCTASIFHGASPVVPRLNLRVWLNFLLAVPFARFLCRKNICRKASYKIFMQGCPVFLSLFFPHLFLSVAAPLASTHTHTRTLTHSHVNLWSFPFSSAGAIIPRPFLSSQPLCPSLFLLLRLLLGCFLCLALFTVSSLQLRYVQDARLVYVCVCVCVWKREGPQRIKRDGGKKEIGIRGSLA